MLEIENTKLYTVPEIAKILRVWDQFVRNLCARRLIESINIGTPKKPLYKIYGVDLKFYLKNNYSKNDTDDDTKIWARSTEGPWSNAEQQ